jgi:hypothetical protein
MHCLWFEINTYIFLTQTFKILDFYVKLLPIWKIENFKKINRIKKEFIETMIKRYECKNGFLRPSKHFIIFLVNYFHF